MARRRALDGKKVAKKSRKSGNKASALTRKKQNPEAAAINRVEDAVDDNVGNGVERNSNPKADDSKRGKTQTDGEEPLWGDKLVLYVAILIVAAPILMYLSLLVFPPPVTPVMLPIPLRADLPPPMVRLSPADIERRMRMVPYLGPYHD